MVASVVLVRPEVFGEILEQEGDYPVLDGMELAVCDSLKTPFSFAADLKDLGDA